MVGIVRIPVLFGAGFHKIFPILKLLVERNTIFIRICDSCEIVVVNKVVLWRNRTSTEIFDKSNLRGVMLQETKENATSRLGLPFWQFASIMNDWFKDVCWTSPDVRSF